MTLFQLDPKTAPVIGIAIGLLVVTIVVVYMFGGAKKFKQKTYGFHSSTSQRSEITFDSLKKKFKEELDEGKDDSDFSRYSLVQWWHGYLSGLEEGNVITYQQEREIADMPGQYTEYKGLYAKLFGER